MKKVLFFICLIICFFAIAACILDLKPFSAIDRKAEEDYINYYQELMQFISENNGEMIITRESYDKSSESAHKIFEDLKYQFVRVNHDNVFFCKDYDGMSGIGLLYSEVSFQPNPKQKVIKILDEKWMIISEHNL